MTPALERWREEGEQLTLDHLVSLGPPGSGCGAGRGGGGSMKDIRCGHLCGVELSFLCLDFPKPFLQSKFLVCLP